VVNEIINGVTRVFEVAGVAIIALGSLLALGRGFYAWTRHRDAGAYYQLRSDLGRSILLGLEILVAADIVRTVAIEPTLLSVAVLGLIVLIRTFLSFSLDVEIDGAWPWRRFQSDRRPAGRPRASSAGGVPEQTSPRGQGDAAL
jgi:uncharacterized membrane protein